MTRKTALSLLLAATLAGSAGSAAAQDVTAAVRTWSGQSWQVTQPSLEVFYTIVSRTQESAGGGGAGTSVGQFGSMATLGLAGLDRQYVDPSLFTLNRLFGRQAPDTIQGHRQAQEITVYRGGVAIQIAVSSIASLAFAREPVQDSSLPPYIAPKHVRSAATVLLTDGTRVDADYVNLGGMLLRGAIPGGRVDIPWQDIQTLDFRR